MNPRDSCRVVFFFIVIRWQSQTRLRILVKPNSDFLARTEMNACMHEDLRNCMGAISLRPPNHHEQGIGIKSSQNSLRIKIMYA